MNENKYYDGTKLLSMKDINGNTPELFLCTTNRTGGKTTYYGRLCVNRFMKDNEKFALLYRFNYELSDVASEFFKDIGSLFFQGHVMTSKAMRKGTFQELFLDNVSCGYAIALNNADQVKRFSHYFSDVHRILFDEFQSETNHYCTNEIEKFYSIHTSIARGQGEQVRYVPVYLLGNAVSLLNPYYTALGISSRLKEDTKFLRGDGFVLEQGYVESASRAQKESGFNRAFSASKYSDYASENVYLNDNMTFIEKPEGTGRYLATIKYNGCEFAIREFIDDGVIYCDDRPDKTFPHKIAVTTDDHEINYVMLNRNSFFLSNMRFLFERGSFRFKNLKCKEAIMAALSI